MRKFTILFIGAVLFTVNVCGQNIFPSDDNVKIDGYSLQFIRPSTAGGWARGLNYYDTDNATRYSGIGLFGSSTEARYFYIAHGTFPYSSKLGLYILSDGKVGIGTTNPNEELEVNGNIVANQYKFKTVYYDFSASPRTQLKSMSLKLFDDYNVHRPGGEAPGGNNYGTLLSIYGRVNHWEHNLYFGANKRLYFRTSTWTGGSSENGTGEFNDWRTILDSKSSVESSGNLKITGTGDHYIASGNIGIGTTSPGSKLDIKRTSSGKALQLLGENLDVDFHIGHDGNISGFYWRYKGSQSGNNNDLQLWTNNVTSADKQVYNIHQDGNIKFLQKVSIGCEVMSGYELSVKGTISCGEIKVEDVSGWADFVFEEGYDLMPLQELDNYIKENNHLPEIPTEKDVKENGISVGEMNAKLLQKIEELTLYVIELKKENEEQKQINAEQTQLIKKIIENTK